jgi:hypothetical protein
LIYVVEDLVGSLLAVFKYQVIADPRYKVVLERPLDHLVEEIRGEHLVNISTREIVCGWLHSIPSASSQDQVGKAETYMNVTINTI